MQHGRQRFHCEPWSDNAIHILQVSTADKREISCGAGGRGTVAYQLNPVCPPDWGMNSEIGKSSFGSFHLWILSPSDALWGVQGLNTPCPPLVHPPNTGQTDPTQF